jgi:ATP synthase protein I
MSSEIDAQRAMDEANARLVRRCVIAMLVGAVAVLAIGAALGGQDGFVGALVGTAIVLVFFGIDLVVLRSTWRLEPTSVLAVVVMVYTLKVTLLAVFLVALRGTTLFDATTFAVAVIGLTSVALACALALVAKRRTLIVDPAAFPPENPRPIADDERSV